MTDRITANRIHTAALAALESGIAVIPIRSDGTKMPAGKWAKYQTELPELSDVERWFGREQWTGYALICGVGSGNLEALDFDDEATYAAYCDTAESLGLGHVVDRLRAGYEERTPGSGRHLPYFCDTISGNQKLARAADGTALIETRGIGGYIIAAPSNGSVHPSGGAWELLSGDVATIATITVEERDALLKLARSFDQTPPIERDDAPRSPRSDGNGARPGDDYRNRHGSLAAMTTLLERHGWRLVHRIGEAGYFRRPGKSESWSATYNHAGCGLFYVFTSSAAPFEPERAYNPFSVYVLLEHHGDFAAAAKQLASEGYGTGKGVSLGEITFTKRKPTDPKTRAFEPAPIPPGAIRGWLERYVDLMEPTTEAPDAFHVASAMTFVGAMIGKRVGLFHASDELYANFYTLLIGPSGRSRKDTAIRRMRGMFFVPPPPGKPLIATGMPFMMARDISSAEGLIAMLRENSNMLLYTSEFAKLMNNANRENTRSIGPTLIEAFDCPPSLQNNTVGGVEDSKGKPREARNPFVSIIATVQPEILAELIGSQQQYSGFLNRWLLVCGDGKGARPNPPPVDTARSYELIHEADAAIKSYPDGTLLRLDGDAESRWGDWYVATYPKGQESAQEDAMGIRRSTIVKKIALAHAILARSPSVTATHLDVGIALGDWCWEHTKRLIPTWGESRDAQLARKITERLQRGPMHKRPLQHSVASHIGPGVFGRCLKDLVELGNVIVTEGGMVALAEEP
jgi:hypothetical protein